MHTSLDHGKLEVYKASLEFTHEQRRFCTDCQAVHQFAINWIAPRLQFR